MTRRGVTLPELVLTVALVAIVCGIAAPRVMRVANAAALREAKAEVHRALDAARGAAIRLGQPVELITVPGALRVVAAPGPVTLWQSPDQGERGVTLEGLSAPIRFGPAGVAIGASNRTLRLRRGHDTVDVVLSRLGRIR